ncbi:hypothetical protein [Xanthomonas euvesicatoria]|uniref:hypothetical protein n=1 Tax=Xanthomonas euvesicatoria TaxID=456327 RepID=UPI001C448612|nr:hypothetical protein [Xanthomonas euvesicatoria]MBV6851806.1 hypothetical protein [Xanthomonas campestris pv. heliotropii]
MKEQIHALPAYADYHVDDTPRESNLYGENAGFPDIKKVLISPNPQLDFCCSPANSFVLPMFSMMSDLGAADARSRCEVLSAKTPWRPGIGRV